MARQRTSIVKHADGTKVRSLEARIPQPFGLVDLHVLHTSCYRLGEFNTAEGTLTHDVRLERDGHVLYKPEYSSDDKVKGLYYQSPGEHVAVKVFSHDEFRSLIDPTPTGRLPPGFSEDDIIQLELGRSGINHQVTDKEFLWMPDLDSRAPQTKKAEGGLRSRAMLAVTSKDDSSLGVLGMDRHRKVFHKPQGSEWAKLVYSGGAVRQIIDAYGMNRPEPPI